MAEIIEIIFPNGKTEGEIDYIPSNEEKYISFTKKMVVDSFTPRMDPISEDDESTHCHICKDLLEQDSENPTVAEKLRVSRET